MPLFDPELSWTRPRSIVLGLLVAALVLLAAIAPSARAQEVPSAPPPDTTAPATADGPVDAGPPPEVTPTPEPSPEPSPPPPPPEVVEPPLEPPPPPDEPSQPASPKNSDPQRDTGHAASPAPSVTVTTPSPPAAAPAPTVAVVDPQLTAAPLGWDVYDDALFAETVDGDKGSAVLAGGGPPAVGGLGVLGPASRSIAREKHKDAAAGSRPNATPVGGSGPGGGGPGHGPSMGLAGSGGGGGAGIALLMLLGLACAWSLLAPRDRRAFRTSTATWRPSAYVPPIEHPG
jgi:hypothetical protein